MHTNYDKLQQAITTLPSELKETALDFAAFLQANDFVPFGEHGAVTYGDTVICYMHLDSSNEPPGPWTIWLEGDYSTVPENFDICDSIKETAWSNVNICASCGGGCSPGKRVNIFGRDFDNVCNAAMAFTSPDAVALECVKELFAIRKWNGVS